MLFFFFKQKTAYEMRISDWSSDVCSSDLSRRGLRFLSDDMIALRAPDGAALPWPLPHSIKQGAWPVLTPVMPEIAIAPIASVHGRAIKFIVPQRPRSEERRVWTGCVSQLRSWLSPDH